MSGFISAFLCAFVGAVVGGAGALWWGVNFKSLAPNGINPRDPAWRQRSGCLFSAVYPIGIVGGIVMGFLSRRGQIPFDPVSFDFFARCALPTMILSFVAGLSILYVTAKASGQVIIDHGAGGNATPKVFKRCPKCGKQLPKTAIACMYCRASLVDKDGVVYMGE